MTPGAGARRCSRCRRRSTRAPRPRSRSRRPPPRRPGAARAAGRSPPRGCRPSRTANRRRSSTRRYRQDRCATERRERRTARGGPRTRPGAAAPAGPCRPAARRRARAAVQPGDAQSQKRFRQSAAGTRPPYGVTPLGRRRRQRMRPGESGQRGPAASGLSHLARSQRLHRQNGRAPEVEIEGRRPSPPNRGGRKAPATSTVRDEPGSRARGPQPSFSPGSFSCEGGHGSASASAGGRLQGRGTEPGRRASARSPTPPETARILRQAGRVSSCPPRASVAAGRASAPRKVIRRP